MSAFPCGLENNNNSDFLCLSGKNNISRSSFHSILRRDFGSVFAASGSVSKLPEHLSKHITYISTSSGGCALRSSVNNKEINSINNTHHNSHEIRAGTILFRRCGAL